MTATDATPPEGKERTGAVAAAGPTDAELAQTYDQLSRLLNDFEAVEWRTVPEFSVAEAAALAARLEESRNTIKQQRDGQP